MNSANHYHSSFLYRACIATLCCAPVLAAAQTNAPLTAPGAAVRTAPALAPATQTYRPAINTVQAQSPMQASPDTSVSQAPIRTVQAASAAPQPTYTSPQPVYSAPQPVYAAPQAAYVAPAPAPVFNSDDDLGITTRGLLAAQADGRRAGPELPILGPVATASWQRYVESFEHPIPEYFVTRVNTGGASGGN